jgi:hypothetical protein
MPFSIFTDANRYRGNELRGYTSYWRSTHVNAQSAYGGGSYRIGLVNIDDHVVKLQLSGETVKHLFEELACLDYFRDCLKPDYLETIQKEVASRRRSDNDTD